MTAKEFLSQAYLLDLQINSKIAQVEQLNLLAQKCTATISNMPKNPNRGGSRLADAVCKIVDLQEEINADIDRLVDLKREITERIKAVPNAEYRFLLEKRYLCFKPWNEIAEDLGYSVRHLYRVHDAALENLQVPKT